MRHHILFVLTGLIAAATSTFAHTASSDSHLDSSSLLIKRTGDHNGGGGGYSYCAKSSDKLVYKNGQCACKSSVPSNSWTKCNGPKTASLGKAVCGERGCNILCDDDDMVVRWVFFPSVFFPSLLSLPFNLSSINRPITPSDTGRIILFFEGRTPFQCLYKSIIGNLSDTLYIISSSSIQLACNPSCEREHLEVLRKLTTVDSFFLSYFPFSFQSIIIHSYLLYIYSQNILWLLPEPLTPILNPTTLYRPFSSPSPSFLPFILNATFPSTPTATATAPANQVIHSPVPSASNHAVNTKPIIRAPNPASAPHRALEIHATVTDANLHAVKMKNINSPRANAKVVSRRIRMENANLSAKVIMSL